LDDTERSLGSTEPRLNPAFRLVAEEIIVVVAGWVSPA
jgi:hypothetical protein